MIGEKHTHHHMTLRWTCIWNWWLQSHFMLLQSRVAMNSVSLHTHTRSTATLNSPDRSCDQFLPLLKRKGADSEVSWSLDTLTSCSCQSHYWHAQIPHTNNMAVSVLFYYSILANATLQPSAHQYMKPSRHSESNRDVCSLYEPRFIRNTDSIRDVLRDRKSVSNKWFRRFFVQMYRSGFVKIWLTNCCTFSKTTFTLTPFFHIRDVFMLLSISAVIIVTLTVCCIFESYKSFLSCFMALVTEVSKQSTCLGLLALWDSHLLDETG